MKDDLALYKALKKVNSTGVCVLTDVGTDKGTVAEIARRIAPISHEMLYGETFEVYSQVSVSVCSRLALFRQSFSLPLLLSYFPECIPLSLCTHGQL